MQNQQKKAGLKDRLGAGYAKFGRNGSVWRWEFSWNDTGRGQNGYDNGFLTSNAAIFERLKTRFIYGVLENANYHLKANYFRVYLIDTEDKTKDELIISLRFDNATENGKEYLTPIFSFSQYAKDELSKASILYLEDVFAEYALKLKNKYIGEKNTVNSLIRQANESVQLTPNATPTPAQALTLQERYNDAVSVVFANKNNFKLSFLKLKVAQQETTLIITNLVDLNFTVENYETNFDEKFAPYLREIIKILGYERLEYVFSAPKAQAPQPVIAQADNVAETKKLIEKIQQQKEVGGEVKSISNFGFSKKLPEKTPQEVAFLEKLTFLRQQGDYNGASELTRNYYQNT